MTGFSQMISPSSFSQPPSTGGMAVAPPLISDNRRIGSRTHFRWLPISLSSRSLLGTYTVKHCAEMPAPAPSAAPRSTSCAPGSCPPSIVASS